MHKWWSMSLSWGSLHNFYRFQKLSEPQFEDTSFEMRKKCDSLLLPIWCAFWHIVNCGNWVKMLFHPISYSSGPPAGGTPQILIFKTLRMTGWKALYMKGSSLEDLLGFSFILIAKQLDRMGGMGLKCKYKFNTNLTTMQRRLRLFVHVWVSQCGK